MTGYDYRARALATSLAAVLLAACSGPNNTDATGTSATSQALTAEQSRVLGFEAPTQDWRTSNGSSVTSSTTVSQGAAALALQLNGYTEVISTPIGAPGGALATASVDLRLTQTLGWGELRVVVRAPSQGVWWRDLGAVSLGGRAPGVYHNLSFSVPQDVRELLNGSASDIEFRIIVNGPAGSYLLDNLIVAEDTGDEDPGSSPTEAEAFSVAVPRGMTLPDVMISTTERITIDDGSTLAVDTEPTEVVNLGSGLLEFGARVRAFADVTSVGDVSFLRSGSQISGSLTTAGQVIRQDNVSIGGSVVTGASVQSAATEWTVDWPAEVTTDLSLPPDAPNHEVVPGAYDSIQVFSRATATFRSGTYFINSLVMEPQAHFRVDTSSGPVLLYVKDTLRVRVGLEYLAGERGQVLFGYLGQQPALFEEALVATVVAPNSVIELRRPNSGLSHEGSYFGKEVHVFSDATVLHLPFDWSFLCPQGDRDGDGVLACNETCDNDPNKTEPEFCGCGEPETHSDTDGLPDCIEECDLAPNDSYRGQCGCAGEPGLAPAGTPCNDGIADGDAVCDGAGLCGDPMAGAPEAGCFWKTLGTHAYWFCPAASAADAAARCNSSPGGRLVQIDTALENHFVAHFVQGRALIGATDRTTEGEWTWRYTATLDAKKFWTGGAQGKAYRGLFAAFGGGEPRNDDGLDCGTIDPSGRWSAASCTEALPYVCERPFGPSWNPGDGRSHEPVGPEDVYVDWYGRNGGGNGSTVPFDQCVTHDPGEFAVRPEYDGAILRDDTVQAYDCDRLCPEGSDKTEAECQALCTGAATPPPIGSTSRCGGTGNPSRQLAEILPHTCAPDDPGTTDVNEADCSHVTLGGLPTVCGEQTRCFEVRKRDNGEWTAQTCASGCAAGSHCDSETGLCLDPSKDEACDTLDGDLCVGQCFNQVGCGILVTVDDGGYTEADLRCEETRFCPEGGVDSSPLNSPELTQYEPIDLSQLPDESQAPPPAYSGDFTTACAGGSCSDCAAQSGPSCDRSQRHPWCNLDAGLSEGSDGDAEVRDTRRADRGGDSSLIRFDVDPNADLDFNVEPLPFGLARFDLTAAAAIRSVASFDFANIRGEVEIVDLRGQLSASLCRVSTAESKMEILGADFLPSLAGDLRFDTATDFVDVTEDCEGAVATFVDTVDRAKKALRDAQELIRQYDELKEAGRTFGPGFCAAVAGAGQRPPGMPGAGLADPCAGESPEDTINAFISYYQTQVGLIDGARQALADTVLDSKSLASVLGLGGRAPASSGFDFYADFGNLLKGEQTTTIITVNFFIGPVPCNLEVSSYMNYGIQGGLGVNLWPQALIDGNGEFAKAGAIIMPYADSGVTLFVGVGFDAGPLSLKVGLEGSITLANIELPATASAGLAVNPEPISLDERPLPEDLAGLTNGTLLYPANGGSKRYNFQFVYSYGVDMTLSDILSGHLDGSVVVKFFWFKKKWSQQLVAFEGLPPIGPLNLIGGGSPAPSEWPNEPVAEDTQTWTSGYDSVPFVAISPLGAPAAPLTADGSFDDGRVAQLYYDSLCTCDERGAECNRKADCCDATDACFSDPALGGGTKVCSACRQFQDATMANPEGLHESCNVDEDCCSGGECRTGATLRTNCRPRCEDPTYEAGHMEECHCDEPLYRFFHESACEEWEESQGGIIIVDPSTAFICDEYVPPHGVCFTKPTDPGPVL